MSGYWNCDAGAQFLSVPPSVLRGDGPLKEEDYLNLNAEAQNVMVAKHVLGYDPEPLLNRAGEPMSLHWRDGIGHEVRVRDYVNDMRGCGEVLERLRNDGTWIRAEYLAGDLTWEVRMARALPEGKLVNSGSRHHTLSLAVCLSALKLSGVLTD